MPSMNRDLLVLKRTDHLTEDELNSQLDLLKNVLEPMETWDVFCTVNEVIDINKHRIYRKAHVIRKEVTDNWKKPFLFVYNKN